VVPPSASVRPPKVDEPLDAAVGRALPLASATTGGALRVDGGYVDSILP
jgi:hypothetical protein